MKIGSGRLAALLMASLPLLGAGPDPAHAQLLGPEFRVNTYTTGYQFWPAVAAGGAGGFVVVWIGSGQDGSGLAILGQRFDSAGLPAGSEFAVNTTTAGNQRRPAVAADGAGWGVYARTMTTSIFADGFETGDVCAWSGTVGGGTCPSPRASGPVPL